MGWYSDLKNNRFQFKKLLVHKGNVNFSTGNITYDGPVIIKGDIEGDVTIHVQGDVIVHGAVLDGDISVKGDLTVKGGIRSGGRCHVKVRGNLKTEFIENSVVEVTRDLTIKKAIVGGLILCGGRLQLKGLGNHVYGCKLYIHQELSCHNLGKNTAKRSDIFLGMSYKMSQRTIKIRKRRHFFEELLQGNQESFQQMEKDYVARKSAELAKDIKNKKRRILKIERILKTLEQHLKTASRNSVHNKKARCFVKGQLSRNCFFHLGSDLVKTPTDMVAITVHFNGNAKAP